MAGPASRLLCMVSDPTLNAIGHPGCRSMRRAICALALLSLLRLTRWWLVIAAMNVLTYGSNTGLWMALVNTLPTTNLTSCPGTSLTGRLRLQFGSDLNDGLMGVCGK